MCVCNRTTNLNGIVLFLIIEQTQAWRNRQFDISISYRRSMRFSVEHFYNASIHNYVSLDINNGAGISANTRAEKRAPAPGMSLTGSFFTFVRAPRQRECIKRQQETRYGNIHVRLCPPGRWKKKPWQMLSGNPLARQHARARARIGALKLLKKRK